jgi:hypothetical protein
MAKSHLKLVTPAIKNEQLPQDGAETATYGPVNT